MSTHHNIIHQTRPIPSRPRMPRQNRAKIFAPYQALKGFSETVHAKDTVYVPRVELAEYAQERLDWKLRRLQRGDTVTVTWFQSKSGAVSADVGQYVTMTGMVERIDHVFHVLHISKRRVPIGYITELRGEHLDGISEWEIAGEVPTPEETGC